MRQVLAEIEGTNPADLRALIAGRGLMGQEALARATLVEAETGERFASVLTRLGMLSEAAIANALAESCRLPLLSAEALPDKPLFGADRVSPRFLRDRRAVPVSIDDDGVRVAFADPLDAEIGSALELVLERPVLPAVALASDIDAALDRHYQTDAVLAEEALDAEDLERLKDLASDAPAIRAVNRLITRAGELQASDIHLEPTDDALSVRFRIDGALRDVERLPAALKQSLVSRIKVMANLDISERRLPQDGRLRLAVRGHEIDLRVAIAPTIHGESVVMRLLDRSNVALDLAQLGFSPAQADAFAGVIGKPHGIVLVTGPTGSGKTTTLYAALTMLNRPERKILTIEDPIEYRLAGIGQTQAQPAIGLSFATALRSFLRQDPDVMMVGEIRDVDTAQIAVQAALTGHLILSTLHTNSAAAAVARLVDMGVEPFLINSTLNAVLAQRLVRRLCGACREPYAPPAALLESAGVRPEKARMLYRPVGCAACGGSGFRGRVALVELLVVDDRLATLIGERAESRELERAAVATGMQRMFDDGVAKAAAGLTTLEDVLRVTREE